MLQMAVNGLILRPSGKLGFIVPQSEQKYVEKHSLKPLGIATPVCGLVRKDPSSER